MRKTIAVFLITLSLLIFVITQAMAEGKGNQENSEHANKPQVITSDREIGKNISQTIIKGFGENHPDWKGFELSGTISNLTATTFDLNGKTIKIDATVSGKIQINGTLANDAYAKVEGKIVDGNYYAREIKVGVKANKDQDENDNKDNISPTVTPSVSPTPGVSVSPTPSATPTAGNVEKIGNQLKISITGSLADVIKALENLLNTLKSQV